MAAVNNAVGPWNASFLQGAKRFWACFVRKPASGKTATDCCVYWCVGAVYRYHNKLHLDFRAIRPLVSFIYCTAVQVPCGSTGRFALLQFAKRSLFDVQNICSLMHLAFPQYIYMISFPAQTLKKGGPPLYPRLRALPWVASNLLLCELAHLRPEPSSVLS